MRLELLDLLRCPRTGARLDLEVLEADGDAVEVGLLRGPGATYPIVAGIAVLRGGDEAVVERLGRGDAAGATALAVVRDLPLARVGALLPLLAELRPTRRAARRLAARVERSAVARGRAALAAAADDPGALLRLTHLEHRRPNVEGYHYFRHRLGTPRHLVALGALAAARPEPGPVVEVGCGAGALTWQLDALLGPRPVVGIDRQLDLLWVARHHAPDAGLVCGDATALPLADGACALAVAVDVLSFVERKATAARELRRVLRPGGGVVATSLINAAARHEFAGLPLPVAGWRSLLGPRGHVALADTTVLDRYLGGSTPPAASDPDPVLEDARTVTVLVGAAATSGLGQPLGPWPHGVGRLDLHPLLHEVEVVGTDAVVRRRDPSAGFARDNADLDRYLPGEVRLDRALLDAVRRGERPAPVDGLLGAAVLVGRPPADRRPVGATA